MAAAGLKKQIGLWTLVSIGLGAIIGSGIFALVANMAAIAGPGMLISIFIAGAITLLLALCYAELGSAFPLTGGPYALPRLAMGDLVGFVMGWGYFLYLFVGTAAIIQIFVVYLGFYIPGLSIGTNLTPYGTMVGLVSVWFFTFINYFGVRWGGIYSIITTIGKMLPIILFIVVGVFSSSSVGNFEPFVPYGFAGISLGVTLFFWSFTGFESIVIPGEEVKNPKRTIPLAMILTMLITLCCYLLVAYSFLNLINWEGLSIASHNWKAIGRLDFPLASVALSSKLGLVAILITIGAVIATGGSGGTWILLQGRMPFAMALDELFYSKMKLLNRFGVPGISLFFSSFLTSAVLILLPHFSSVSLIASITAIVPYSAAVLSVPILRKKMPGSERPFKVPFVSLFTLVAFIVSTWLIYWASWPWTMIGTILLLIGYILFYTMKGKLIDAHRGHWMWVYLLGISILSFFGTPPGEVDNFLGIEALGWISAPWDLLILALFATAIYFFALSSASSAEE